MVLASFSRSLLIATASSVGLASCSIDDLDLTGKQCPCADGWVCDAGRNACVPAGGAAGSAGAPAGAGGTGGVGADGGTGGVGNVEPAAVRVSDLRVIWTTPNSIRWQWSMEGVADQLLGLELTTGTSEQDVVHRTGSARTFTEADNPELGRYFLPATGGEDPVIATTTDALEPSTQYFGQLVAIDTAGQRSSTNIAGGRTTDPPAHTIVIFDDTDTPGYSIPASFVLSDRAPYAGTHHYDYVQSCTTSETTCYENLRRQGLGLDLSSISEGALSTTAYFELAVASGGPTPSYWSEFRIMTGTSPGSPLWGYRGFTIRADGSYRLYQIPVRVLEGSAPISHADLTSGLYEICVGGAWQDGSHTMVDEIRVRW